MVSDSGYTSAVWTIVFYYDSHFNKGMSEAFDSHDFRVLILLHFSNDGTTISLTTSWHIFQSSTSSQCGVAIMRCLPFNWCKKKKNFSQLHNCICMVPYAPAGCSFWMSGSSGLPTAASIYIIVNCFPLKNIEALVCFSIVLWSVLCITSCMLWRLSILVSFCM